MASRHRVRIKTTTPPMAEVYVDDKKIEATKFKFEHDAGCLAMLTLYGFEDTEIDEEAMVVVEKGGMSADEYRKKLIDTLHRAGADELIAIVCLPNDEAFKALESLLKREWRK